MTVNAKSYANSRVYFIVVLLFIVVLMSACKPDLLPRQLGNQSFKSGDYSGAIDYYKQSLELHPSNAGLNFNIALCYRKLKDYWLATEYIITAIELEEKDEKKIKYENLMTGIYKVLHEDAEVKDTIDIFQDFLDRFPHMLVKYALPGRLGEMRYFKESAEKRLQDLIFTEVKLTDIVKAYEAYLRFYPDSPYREEAQRLLDQKRFENAKEEGTIEALRQFKKDFPDNPHVSLVDTLIDDLVYDQYKYKEEIENFTTFLTKYPDNKHYKKAMSKLYEMIDFKREVALYEKFIDEFPKAEQVKRAMTQVEKLHYEATKKANTLKAYREFIDEFPTSKYLKAAKNKLEQLNYERAKKENSVESYQTFKDEFPESRYSVAVEKKILDLIYDKVKKKNTIMGYMDFINENPMTKYEDDAKGKIMTLEYRSALDTDTKRAFLQFITKYKDTEHENTSQYREIEGRLDELSTAELDELETVTELEEFILRYAGKKPGLVRLAKKKIDRIEFRPMRHEKDITKLIRWLKKHPDSPFVNEVKSLVDDKRFKAATEHKQKHTIIQFIEDNPNSRHREDAEALLADMIVAEINALKTINAVEVWIDDNQDAKFESKFMSNAYNLLYKYEYDKVKNKKKIRYFELFIKDNPDSPYLPDAKRKVREFKEKREHARKLMKKKKEKSLKAILKYSDNSQMILYNISFSYEFNRQPPYTLISAIDKSALGFEVEENRVRQTYINSLKEIDAINFTYKKAGRLTNIFGSKKLVLKRIRIAYRTEMARDLNDKWNKKYLDVLEDDDPKTYYTEITLRGKNEKDDVDIKVPLFEINPAEPYIKQVIFKRSRP